AQPPDIHGWSALDAGVACLSLRACTGKGCRPLRASGAVSIYRLRGWPFAAVRFRCGQIRYCTSPFSPSLSGMFIE
ncbi:MAG TPA: hypothetical protein PKY68_03055, partial [Bacteroidales bacterium]|nr:hypothetical protein [Bacteroidales bacterium]